MLTAYTRRYGYNQPRRGWELNFGENRHIRPDGMEVIDKGDIVALADGEAVYYGHKYNYRDDCRWINPNYLGRE